jgi:hypothetical protein
MAITQSKYCFIQFTVGARDSVVGLGTMLKAGRSQVPFSITYLDLSIDLILPAALRPWGRLTLTERVSGIPGTTARPTHKADNLTAISESRFSIKCRSLDDSQPYGTPRPVTGIALPSFTSALLNTKYTGFSYNQ